MRILIVIFIFFLIIFSGKISTQQKAKYIEIKQNTQKSEIFHGILKANNSTTLSFQSEEELSFSHIQKVILSRKIKL